jgi:single-stranded DNA-binding protein
MDKELLKNNNVTLLGMIVSNPEFSHEVFGEKFFRLNIKVERTSGTADIIPLTVSERLIDVTENWIDVSVYVSGQFRSFNRHEGNKSRLALFVFVREIEKMDATVYGNNIALDGFICKEPTYRNTPRGREIADLLIGVNRSYGKSDYIPCIVWGRNAVYASGLPVGTHLKITGRIQSRKYTKRYLDGAEEERTAYEVSVSKIEEKI